jgi:hypothetical protein
MSVLRQLTKLLHPFPTAVVHNNPGGGGTYVKHSTVEQRLLDVLGCPPNTTFVREIRGDAPGKKDEALTNVVVGVILRMEATVDGHHVVVEEAGDCELPSNWKHDGARMKDAMSDAYKRCAMRLGVGLHLWSQDDFYLSEKMLKQDQEAES